MFKNVTVRTNIPAVKDNILYPESQQTGRQSCKISSTLLDALFVFGSRGPLGPVTGSAVV